MKYIHELWSTEMEMVLLHDQNKKKKIMFSSSSFFSMIILSDNIP